MSSEYLLRSGQVIRANFLSCRHVGPMLGLASLMTIGILGLCVAQDIGTLPARLRAIFDGTTASVKHDEDSSPNHDSSQLSSLPHSLHSDHHVNKTKQRLHLNSKFSRNEVVAWDETENKAMKAESGKRFEKQQVNTDDEGKHVVEWTPLQTNAKRRRRVETLHSSETSSYKLQRQMPNSVGDTSKKPPHIKRQRRSSPIKKKSSGAVLVRDRSLRRRAALEESLSSAAGLDAKRSKTGIRKSRTASRDSYHENADSKKRRRLNRRQEDEDYTEDEEMEESLGDEEEEELKDERDVGLEESVEKRDSDEVMISKDLIAAMNERIMARVKDFIDKNTEKKGSSSSNSTEVVSGGMGVGGGNATTEASSSTVHPQSSTSH